MASSSFNPFEEMNERFDQICNQQFDQQFENLLIHYGEHQESSRSKNKRAYIERE